MKELDMIYHIVTEKEYLHSIKGESYIPPNKTAGKLTIPRARGIAIECFPSHS
jgi:hypothetical protein